MTVDPRLPAAGLIEAGLRSYRAGEASIAALLVAIGRPRLRSLGFDLPARPGLCHEPELALYRLLATEHGNGAHSRYNALIRALVSFERAAARRSAVRSRRRGEGSAARLPLQREEEGVLQRLDDPALEAHGVGAVDDAVVVRER